MICSSLAVTVSDYMDRGAVRGEFNNPKATVNLNGLCNEDEAAHGEGMWTDFTTSSLL